MKRFFRLALTALAMLVVALISALVAMRFAIHGAEVEVPNLTNLTIPEASELTLAKNLQLTLANRYYSLDTPAGRILSQSPAGGTRVRRGWQVRITESLGAQKVEIPDVIGQDQRTATVNIRRLGLDLGTVASIPAPGDPGIVLAQTPPPNAEGVDRPRVSLLISTPLTPETSDALVVPNLIGLTAAQARDRIAAAGLRLGYLGAAAPAAPATTPGSPTDIPAASATPVATEPGALSLAHSGDSGNEAKVGYAPADAAPVHTGSGSYVTAQSPQPGRRIARGDLLRLAFSGQ